MQSVLSKSNLLAEPHMVNYIAFKKAFEQARAQYVGEDLSYLGIDSMDCCGTGGSGQSKFNYSTACAFILNAGGVKVTKFGNRSATGSSGSQDFLDMLGIANSVSVSSMSKIFDKAGIIFLNAGDFYHKLKELAPARKILGRPTILNYLAPLLNPCKPSYRLMGVSNGRMQLNLAKLLMEEGSLKKALLIRSENNLDELDPLHNNSIIEISKAGIQSGDYVPITFKKQFYSSNPNNNFTAQDNSNLFNRMIKGEDSTSVEYKALVLNAGAGFYACDKVSSIEDGISLSEELIKNGYVLKTLEKTRSAYNEYSR